MFRLSRREHNGVYFNGDQIIKVAEIKKTEAQAPVSGGCGVC